MTALASFQLQDVAWCVRWLQNLSGVTWLLPAVYLTPRIANIYRPGATRLNAIWARNGFLSWLMVGYALRWLAWPTALRVMHWDELLAWGALYSLSSVCAVWFFHDARTAARRGD